MSPSCRKKNKKKERTLGLGRLLVAAPTPCLRRLRRSSAGMQQIKAEPIVAISPTSFFVVIAVAPLNFAPKLGPPIIWATTVVATVKPDPELHPPSSEDPFSSQVLRARRWARPGPARPVSLSRSGGQMSDEPLASIPLPLALPSNVAFPLSVNVYQTK